VMAFFVQSLATVRLLYLLIEEDGPYKAFERFRRLVGINEYGGYDKNNQLAGLFACYLCLGVWLSLLIVFLYNLHTITYWIVWCLAVAQGSAFIYALFDRINQ